MFNFTTQTIYNSISKLENVEKGTRVPKGTNLIITKAGEGRLNPEVRIGNTRFNKENVLDIQIKNHTEENLAKVTFDIDKLFNVVTKDNQDVKMGSYRIVFYLGLSMNSQDSFYANDFVYKGKPLYIEFPVKTNEETAVVVANRIVKLAKRYFLLVAQDQILNATADGGKITFEAVNGYQIIKEAEIQKYDPNAKRIDCCSENGDFITKIVGIPRVFTTNEQGVINDDDEPKYVDEDGELQSFGEDETIVPITPGLEAFGDYNWIIHNLRLPTYANTYFWAPTKLEMPVVGGKYTQFIIRLWKRRDGIGGEVVGQRATSVTTHVLYVLDNSANGDGSTGNVKDVADALNLLVDTENKKDADTVLQKPYKPLTGE